MSCTERTSAVFPQPEWIDWAFSPGRPIVTLAAASIPFRYYTEMSSRNFPKALCEKNRTAVLQVQKKSLVINMLIKMFLVDYF